MPFNISEEQYEELFEEIKSEDSPVGIDAAKTHIIILQKLMDIENRIETLEKHLFGEEG